MKIILASNSPRRRELLAGLGLEFEVRVKEGIDESYPADMPTGDIAEYIATKKAAAYAIADDELLIAADTIVVLGEQVLGKPHSEADACQMLARLSGKTHRVITGCCIKTKDRQVQFSVSTDVTFKALTPDEISSYVARCKPLDKAGAYGIQEWIGYIGVTAINGSYFNVMGLPVQRIYEALRSFR